MKWEGLSTFTLKYQGHHDRTFYFIFVALEQIIGLFYLKALMFIFLFWLFQTYVVFRVASHFYQYCHITF